MKIRKLEIKDAPLMLEWMHDQDVVKKLGANFASKTIEDCKSFITESQNFKENIHLAIADDTDQYMGTVSLKHISESNGYAEFAITIRKVAMGKGFSKYGMSEIIKYGLQKRNLSKIYWCVSKDNQRALRFYDKNAYCRVSDVPYQITKEYKNEQLNTLYWYMVEKNMVNNEHK